LTFWHVVPSLFRPLVWNPAGSRRQKAKTAARSSAVTRWHTTSSRIILLQTSSNIFSELKI
jgi:hypothetical protein